MTDNLTGDKLITFVSGTVLKSDSWGTPLRLKLGRTEADVNLEDFTERFVTSEYLSGLREAIETEIEEYGMNKSEHHWEDPLVIVLRHCKSLIQQIESVNA